MCFFLGVAGVRLANQVGDVSQLNMGYMRYNGQTRSGDTSQPKQGDINL